MTSVHKILIGPLKASKLGKWVYNRSGFNQYGLYRDDCLFELDPAVAIAIKRLPKKLYDERNYRIMRAMQLSMQKIVLPKDQWTTYEKDVKYLEPYIKEVQKEFDEIRRWNSN